MKRFEAALSSFERKGMRSSELNSLRGDEYRGQRVELVLVGGHALLREEGVQVEDREVRGVERELELLGDREDPIDEVRPVLAQVL